MTVKPLDPHVAWLDALARDERFATAFEVEPNRSLRRPGAMRTC
ncbi:hypothetical protein [Streptomyces yangpuensis]